MSPRVGQAFTYIGPLLALTVAGSVVLCGLFWLRARALNLYRVILAVLGLTAVIAIGWWIRQGVQAWVHSSSAPMRHPHTPTFGVHQSLFISPFSTPTLAMHMNPDLVALGLVGCGAIGIGVIFHSLTTPVLRLHMGQFLWGEITGPARNIHSGTYEFSGIELGTVKDTGRPIRIDGKDRFINTLVVGSIGTGKTSRILTKGAYQDLLSIARGVPQDVIVMDPDGGLVDSVLQLARRLQIECSVIDLRDEADSIRNVSFNPFAGGKVSRIVDNVRAVLKEQMGEQERFFQVAQDDLVRTVIQVQVPLWPDTDFIQFAQLITEPLRFRDLCDKVLQCADPSRERTGRRHSESTALEGIYRFEASEVQERWHRLAPNERLDVLKAAQSFLIDTRSEAKLEHLEKVTKGLKMVVAELSTDHKMREVLGNSDLQRFDFRTFFSATREPGRLMAIVTGNRAMGNLFGKLFLVSLHMYAMSRPGTEDTRRPVYVWIDEFPRFATDSLGEWFAQGRKYRTALHLAIQTRAQLKLRANPSFIDVVEGSCRNKVYFPAPAPEDAKYLEKALGTVTRKVETITHNRVGWWDDRRLDLKVSVHEQIDPRFRLEDVLYGLRQHEAIFLMTVDNQMRRPVIGYTSYAEDWLQKRAVSRSRVEPARVSVTQGGRVPEVEQREQIVGSHGYTVAKHEVVPMNRDESSSHQGSKPLDRIVVNEPMKELTNTTKSTNATSVDTSSENPLEQEELMSSRLQLSLVVDPSEDAPKMTQSPLGKPRIDRPRKETVTTKRCPSCPVGTLHLSDDAKKWRCDRCSFERLHRKPKASKG